MPQAAPKMSVLRVQPAGLVSSVEDCVAWADTGPQCWPKDAADKWGYPSTLCMGFVSFAADAQTAGLVSEVCATGGDSQWCDDQHSLYCQLVGKGRLLCLEDLTPHAPA